MAILALGTVLVLAAVAVAPGVAYGQLINVEIANVDCEQEQKNKQDSEQVQKNEQSNEQKSEEILLSEQESEQSNEASQDCSAIDVL